MLYPLLFVFTHLKLFHYFFILQYSSRQGSRLINPNNFLLLKVLMESLLKSCDTTLEPSFSGC